MGAARLRPRGAPALLRQLGGSFRQALLAADEPREEPADARRIRLGLRRGRIWLERAWVKLRLGRRERRPYLANGRRTPGRDSALASLTRTLEVATHGSAHVVEKALVAHRCRFLHRVGESWRDAGSTACGEPVSDTDSCHVAT